MGKEIFTMPEAIRTAGNNISNLDTKTFCTSSLGMLPLSEGHSDGLVAEGVNEIIVELEKIQCLVDKILQEFPRKLDDVAKIIEAHDAISASQFK